MRLRTHHHASAFTKINVTPLIDVVMVLIVFYLIVGKLASERNAKVDLPRAATGHTDDSPGIVVSVVARGAGAAFVLEGREVLAGELAAALRQRLAGTPDAPVHVRADRRLAYADVRPVLTACREAGLRSVKLVAERSP